MPRHIVTDDVSMDADFQDFKGNAMVIVRNAWHTRFEPSGSSLCSCGVSLTYPIGPNESKWPIGGNLISSSSC